MSVEISRWKCVDPIQNHGRKSRGVESPRIWGGDANTNCPPPDLVMFQIFKHQIACITMQLYKAYQPYDSNRVFTTIQK